MKKWIIILSLLFVGGLTTSAALAGNLYYNDMQTYQDQDVKNLDVKALQNIYVESAIPVSVRPTEGEAYVEFNQKYVSIVSQQPTYSLDVQTKGNASYITVKEESFPEFGLFVREHEALCTVYLPKGAIEKLSIKNKEGLSHNIGSGDATFDLKNIDINVLDIETEDASIALDGNYKTININQRYGEIDIHSKSDAQVKVTSYNGSIKLKGKYSKIEAESNNLVEIDSEVPSHVMVRNSGDIKLRGAYKTIDLEALNGGNVDVESDTLCQVNIYSQYNEVDLEGAFKTIRIKSDNGNISVNNTVIPERVEIVGNPSDVTVMLPSNTPGLEVIYRGERYNEGKEIISDFVLERTLNTDSIQKFIFGDKSTRFFIETSNDINLHILDSGYISVKEGV